MPSGTEELAKKAEVLFEYFYDNERDGGFYRSIKNKRDDDIEPDPFATIEALYSLLHSPAKSEYKQQISRSLSYLVRELDERDGKLQPNAKNAACEYSTLGVSFSLIVLTRGRKFIQNHALSEQLEKNVTKIIQTQLELLLEAKQNGGWSYVPYEPESDHGLEFEVNVYCTAIALQALINCKGEDFPKGVHSSNTEMTIVNCFRNLTELAEIPGDAIDVENPPRHIEAEVFEEAVLMTHWMHVFSHVLYEQERWADSVTHPSELDSGEVNDKLKRSSELLRLLIHRTDEYPDQLEHGFADINYILEMKYPKKTDGRIRESVYKFGLPGSTALPALVLNPNIPVWSDANSIISNNVEEQYETRREDLRRAPLGEGQAWSLHHFSAPLVGISYMESINQGIMSLIRYFLHEGEILNVDSKMIDDSSISNSLESRSEPDNELDSLTPNQTAGSTPVRAAVNLLLAIDEYWSDVRHRSSRVWNKARERSAYILFPLFIVSTSGYIYSAVSSFPDIQVLFLAVIAGFITFVTVYDLFVGWIKQRALSMMSGALASIVIITSSAIFTDIGNNITFITGVIIQVISVFANIIANKQ